MSGKMDEKAKNLMLTTLRRSFIENDGSFEGQDKYRPRLIINDHTKGQKVLTTIQKQLQTCEEFIFSVAFISNSGIATLIQNLIELQTHNVMGTVITTDYLYFNDPVAFRRLMKFDNIDLRVITQQSFHVKGYVFKQKDHYAYVIGSSNLTQEALTSNLEWNMEFFTTTNGALSLDIQYEIEALLNLSEPLTEQWLADYEKKYKERQTKKTLIDRPKVLIPNKLQMEALHALELQRRLHHQKALVISATGTGKTYLAAFDAKNCNAKRLLFVIHREQIAKAAMESFQHVFDDSLTMGLYSGNHQDTNYDFLFSTIQTLSKVENLNKFSKDEFDYIVFDEAHRIGAESYQRVLNYFKPKFLLGLTATPERNDEINIYELLDHNIAYEIRLKEALEEDMLCPFHYYGISDILVENKMITDTTQFRYLVSEQRVEHIINKTSLYGFSGDRVKGLMFCSRIEEAIELSEKLNNQGLRTIALSGANSQTEREEAVIRLTTEDENPLDYILTVDIFNEGVDIPDINQIVLLRPTQSAIIFVQQLGRGLRKAPNKEFVVVIDFIGNYKNNFFIPIALSGDRTLNKDNLRKFIEQGNHTIPGSTTVHFEKVVSERILDSVKQTNFATKRFLKAEYDNLKYKVGDIPTLHDFYRLGSVDPRIIMQYKDSYYDFLKIIESDYEGLLTTQQQQYLQFFSMELLSGKRIDELLIIDEILNNNSVVIDDLLQESAYPITMKSIESAINVLTLNFYKTATREKYGDKPVIVKEGNSLYFSDAFALCMKDNNMRCFVSDVVKIGIQIYKNEYEQKDVENPFVLYKKYTRKDVCRLLQWDQDDSSTLYGYTVKLNSVPIFVTYHKKEDISETTKYEDEIIDSNHFSWYTRSNLTLESKEVKEIQKYNQQKMKIDLFVKKDDSEGKEFFYLGELEPKQFTERTIKDDKGNNKPIVNIEYKFKHELHEDIVNYFVQ